VLLTMDKAKGFFLAFYISIRRPNLQVLPPILVRRRLAIAAITGVPITLVHDTAGGAAFPVFLTIVAGLARRFIILYRLQHRMARNQLDRRTSCVRLCRCRAHPLLLRLARPTRRPAAARGHRDGKRVQQKFGTRARRRLSTRSPIGRIHDRDLILSSTTLTAGHRPWRPIR